MSYVFGRRMRDHAKAQWRRLDPRSAVKAPLIQWRTAHSDRASVSTMDFAARRHPEMASAVICPPDEVGALKDYRLQRKAVKAAENDLSPDEDCIDPIKPV